MISKRFARQAQPNFEPFTPTHIISFLTDYAVVGRVIDHLNLMLIAERSPLPHIAYQEVLMAADIGKEYFS